MDEYQLAAEVVISVAHADLILLVQDDANLTTLIEISKFFVTCFSRLKTAQIWVVFWSRRSNSQQNFRYNLNNLDLSHPKFPG
jgi:hypothetical protein